jgi:hypothetical protein
MPRDTSDSAASISIVGIESVSGKTPTAVLFLALTILLTYPLSLQPHRAVLSDDPDTHLFMWTIAWDVHALVHHPWSIFDANIFFPYHDTLAYSENLIGSAVMVAPVIWLTNNSVLAVNAVSILSCMLCGLGAYVLGRRLGLSCPAGIICGLIYAFAPPRFFRFNQLHLTAVQWIPFALASVHAYLKGGRRRDLRLALVFVVLQTYSSGHGALFLITALAVLVLYRAALGEPLLWRRRASDIGLSGALLLALSAVLFLPYRTAQLEVGLRRTLANWETSPESFFASPTHVHTLLRSLFTNADLNANATAYLFPGFLPLALAVAALLISRPQLTQVESQARAEPTVWRRTAPLLSVGAFAAAAVAMAIAIRGPIRIRFATTTLLAAHSAVRAWIVAAALAGARAALAHVVPFRPLDQVPEWRRIWKDWANRHRTNPVPVYLLMALFSVAISLGSPLGIWPLVYWLPGLNFIRVPSRFTVLGVLALAVLAGVGFDRVSTRLPPRLRRSAAVAAAILLLVEFAAIPLPMVSLRLDIPAADQWIARQPRPFVVAEVPVTMSERYQTSYMLHSTAHWQKTIHGYSGIRPPLHDQLYEQLRSFPSEDSIEPLARLGVTYLVVHASWFPSEQRSQLGGGLQKLAPWLTLEYRDSEACVYSLHQPNRNAAGHAEPTPESSPNAVRCL